MKLADVKAQSLRYRVSGLAPNRSTTIALSGASVGVGAGGGHANSGLSPNTSTTTTLSGASVGVGAGDGHKKSGLAFNRSTTTTLSGASVGVGVSTHRHLTFRCAHFHYLTIPKLYTNCPFHKC